MSRNEGFLPYTRETPFSGASDKKPLRIPVMLSGVIEAALASLVLASFALGPFSLKSGALAAWVASAALFFAAYLAVDLWLTRERWSRDVAPSRPLLLSVLLPCTYAVVLFLWLWRPQMVGLLWDMTSPVQPFPFAAAATFLLAVTLLKVGLTSMRMLALARGSLASQAGRVGIPASLLLLGLFQATAYIIVINNATFRYWGIADGIFMGQGYPLTLTEPGPMSAGSPPYVYDLPLFPLLMRVSFGIFGHTSLGAHVPALVSSILFPLSLYLLIREVTGSRATGVLFSALASSFPLLRFWVLNLPDPDPFFLTSLNFAAYLYLRALASPQSWRLWLAAGLSSGVTSLARPEGMLYAGCIGLGLLVSRPRIRQFVIYAAMVALFVLPVVAVWMSNYGFLWPQNYNRTLSLGHALATYGQLDTPGGLALYPKALGMGNEWGLVLLAVFALSVLAGTVVVALRAPRALVFAVPAIGNTIVIWFTDPWISNAFQYADFFRHASFGLPILTVLSACAFHAASKWMRARGSLRVASLIATLILVAAVLREGDILANPTSTHRPGSPLASQALTDTVYISAQTIVDRPMPLPAMEFYRDQSGALIAYLPGVQWPEVALQFFKPLDMSYDSHGRASGYGSMAAFLLALAFATMMEKYPSRRSKPS